MLGEMLNEGAVPVLEASMRFAAQRQRLLAHNIANLSTPDFRPMDVSPAEFQRALARALDDRRGSDGALELNSRQIRTEAGGGLRLTPASPSGNILFHDRNNRDLERMMADLAENTAAFRLASDLLRSRMEMTRSALAQRV